VAEQGAAYFYKGKWGESFVKAVREDGGRMTLKDMADYKVRWKDPLRLSYNGVDVHMYHEGHSLAAMLNLLEAGEVSKKGHYTKKEESFFWISQILRGVMINSGPVVGPSGVTVQELVNKDKAGEVWRKMEAGAFPGVAPLKRSTPRHSDAIVAVDGEGNMAAVLHSINTVIWGENGIFVDGISIPDSATFQQAVIKATGPGKRLRNGTVPLIVMKNGKPLLGISAIGSGIYQETLKVLVNMLDFNMGPEEALAAPSFLIPDFASAPLEIRERVIKGTFPKEILEGARALGLSVDEIPPQQSSLGIGHVACIRVDPEIGGYKGAAPARLNGAALGY
jgi:gamma-glutamyltranspeptidase/glutathione hydrolase